MDALSDVLRVVRLNGAVYLDGEFAAPWCVIGRAEDELCSQFLSCTERVLSFHFITGGICWARLPDDPASAIRIEAGEIVVVPQGEPHILGSATNLKPVPSARVLATQIEMVPGQIMKLTHGGTGPVTRMVCGFLGGENVLGNPLLNALPRLFKVDMRGTQAAWLQSSLQFAAQEAAQMRSGSTTVLGKLSELLFVEAIRRYIDTLPEEQTGWLAGLRDRFVGRALTLLHGRPGARVDGRGSGARGGAFALGARPAVHGSRRRAADAVPRALASADRGAAAAVGREAGGARSPRTSATIPRRRSTARSSANSECRPRPGGDRKDSRRRR